jgi:hypothetical protein
MLSGGGAGVGDGIIVGVNVGDVVGEAIAVAVAAAGMGEGNGPGPAQLVTARCKTIKSINLAFVIIFVLSYFTFWWFILAWTISTISGY